MFDDMRCLGAAIRDCLGAVIKYIASSTMGWCALPCLSRILFWGMVGVCGLAIGLAPMASFMWIVAAVNEPPTVPRVLWCIGSVIWIFLWAGLCSGISMRYVKIKKDKSQ